MASASVRVRYGEVSFATSASADVVARVRAVFAAGDASLDYAAAKLAFDQLIDPTHNAPYAVAQLDRLTESTRQLAGSAATPNRTFAALRRVIYEDGPWNEGRAFAYDQSDPMGQRIDTKLLATYLRTRRGNCVSMPVLFLIMADRLGLDVGLATAPLHMFVRYRSENGQVVNVEATSGGHPSRDEWYRERMPMTDRAISNGVYLRTLGWRESVALIESTVLEWLIERERFEEALAVSDVILRNAPRDAYTMAKQGSVYGELIRREFENRYRGPAMVPAALRDRYAMLTQRNQAAFARAEALGWEPVG